MLPKNFVPMLPEIAEVKYFSGKRPDEIYTSLDMSVNFTFTILEFREMTKIQGWQPDL